MSLKTPPCAESCAKGQGKAVAVQLGGFDANLIAACERVAAKPSSCLTTPFLEPRKTWDDNFGQVKRTARLA